MKAVTFRRVLAEFSYDFETLEKIWQTNKKDGIKDAIDKIVELKEEERQELIDLLDCHFDPEKQPVKPVVKKQRRRSTRRNISEFLQIEKICLKITNSYKNCFT